MQEVVSISPKTRSQYYFRQSDRGLLAWDVRRLIHLSREFPVERVKLADIGELDETHWYKHEGDSPTCRSIVKHLRLITEVDLRYPIILDRDGRVMDGMHRVCKAMQEGFDTIRAVRFETIPDPDFVDCDPEDLCYDNSIDSDRS